MKEGQLLGRIASPETEAQLRAAQVNVDRAKQAMAEAKSLIVERTSVLVAAKSDCERGARAWLQPLIKAQWARRRGWQHP